MVVRNAAGAGVTLPRRLRRLAAAVLAGLLPGCAGWAFVLQPPPQFLGVETWTDVPEGQGAVAAKVGDVLHLPLGPATGGPDHRLPVLFDVTVNGEAPKKPAYLVSLAAVTYAFRAERPGRYRVEVRRTLAGDDEAPLAWDITVSE
jgi:hypothetical protein